MGYSPLDEINTSNAGKVIQKWAFAPKDAKGGPVPLGQVTPLVVDGVMYFNSGSKMFAVNGATGQQVWATEIEPSFGASGRGPAYGDGKIYAYGATTLYAVDAKTGKPIETFGIKGRLSIVNAALEKAYPGKYPNDVNPVSLGYFNLTTPPTYFKGTLYFGLSHGDSHIPGGLLIALDGVTGAVKWTWNPVPQVPTDDAWEVAKDTWKGGQRVGAGIWTMPAIDPELNMIYFNGSNPSPDFDGSARLGENLFTNSTVALNLATGKMVWYYQTIHHDIWDWDLVSGPILFDVQAGGRTVKAIAAPGKTCYVYIFDRQTGKPINPIVEMPVPTFTDVPGDQVWPTQPIPYTNKGIPQQPFCIIYPDVKDSGVGQARSTNLSAVSRQRIHYHGAGQYRRCEFRPAIIQPSHGLLLCDGKNDTFSIKVKPVGDSIKSGKPAVGFMDNIADRGPKGITANQTVAAYNPATGDRIGTVDLEGTTNAGNFVTAGDLVFQTVGANFYALDARTGKEDFRTKLASPSRATAISYQSNGRQYVAVAAGSQMVVYGLP